ncbi:MAG: YihY/virulence factor BrkB family protein, partial [Proteobacteria bacterium]|nr:YihY/virulence factor BrkB family protein [Pseudomonadota bacterium]
AQQLEIPIRLVNDILFQLMKSDIIAETRNAEAEEPGFQPARDINVLTIQYVVEALERRGINTPLFPPAPEFDALTETMETFRKTIGTLPANRLLKEI